MDTRLSEEDKRLLQEGELLILDELDRACKSHGISYFLTAGTLLGAVRHGGFIPWDDDIDVVMTTKDYKKLKKIAKTELSDGFFFQDERTAKFLFKLFRRLPTHLLKVLRHFVKGLLTVFTSGKRLATLGGTHGYPRETYLASWFSGTVMLPFENKEYPAPAGWHDLLTSMYGDYMTPPDEEERHGHFVKENENN